MDIVSWSSQNVCENSPISTDIADAEAMMQKNPTIKKKTSYIYICYDTCIDFIRIT